MDIKFKNKDYTWDIRHDGAWSEFPPEDDCMIEWIYIIDLDHDAFTVDWIARFNMTNWPADWEDHIESDENGRRCVPTKLDKQYLVTDVYAKPPPIDEGLIERYSQIGVVERCLPPEPTNEIKMRILFQLQCDLQVLTECPYDVVSKEWTIHDVQFQKFVYCIVKLSCYDSIEFKLDAVEKDLMATQVPNLLSDVDFPRATEYYVPFGPNEEKKLLISLCTHLDQEEVMKMAVARVVGMAGPDDMAFTACIMSLSHLVLVNYFKTGNSQKVLHTDALELFGDVSKGRQALIATLSSPDFKAEKPVGPAPAVSVEEIDQLFGNLSLTHGGHKTAPNFDAVCKDASNVLHGRTVHFPGRTLLTHQTWLDHCLYGIDDNGAIGLYCLSGNYYPLLCDSKELKIKSYVALVEGVNLGIGSMKLIPVDVDKILNPPVEESEPPKPKANLFPPGFPEPVDISHMFRN